MLSSSNKLKFVIALEFYKLSPVQWGEGEKVHSNFSQLLTLRLALDFHI